MPPRRSCCLGGRCYGGRSAGDMWLKRFSAWGGNACRHRFSDLPCRQRSRTTRADIVAAWCLAELAAPAAVAGDAAAVYEVKTSHASTLCRLQDVGCNFYYPGSEAFFLAGRLASLADWVPTISAPQS
eukprot:355377-Chlamydomonas_euryale.AAC.3